MTRPSGQPDRESKNSPRSLWLLGLLVVAVAGVFLFLRVEKPAETNSADQVSSELAVQKTEDGANRSDIENGETPPNNAMPPPELAVILEENLLPERMVFLQLAMSSNGDVVIAGAQGAAGRAKPLPLRRSPGYLRIDAYDAAGELTFSQTVEDPTRRVIEHPAEGDDGRITASVIERDSGIIFLRLAGESAAHRLELSRWELPALASVPDWQRFASINLPRP